MTFQLQQKQRPVFVVLLLLLSLSYFQHYHHHILPGVGASQHPLWSRIRQRVPFLRRTKQYTPLIFFTVPKGLSSTCDEMERIIRQVEHECHVNVERLDVLRHPENEAVLNMIIQSIRTTSPTVDTTTTTTTSMTMSNPSSMTIQPQPPLLYHRESRQVYQVLPNQPSTTSTTSSKASSTSTASNVKPYIDPDRIRAWAKGRYLSSFITDGTTTMMVRNPTTTSTSSAPIRFDTSNNNEEMDSNHMESLLDEMALSPEQLKGKRLMEERTKAKATSK
jgi:hypothetical protein